jgi:hypothetical protein
MPQLPLLAASFIACSALCAVVSATPPTYNDYLPILQTITADFTVAGYRFGSNARNQTFVDLDLKTMVNAKTTQAASQAYQSGVNSWSMGDPRTMQSMSQDTAFGDPFPKLTTYSAFWGDASQADSIITGALQGSGNYSGLPLAYRLSAASAAAQAHVLWMHVIHELNDQTNICLDGGNFNVEEQVSCWDEAWAFFAGSSVGPDGSAPGYFVYTLSQQMCTLYGTCKASVVSLNQRLLGLWAAGQLAARIKDCLTMQQAMASIVSNMTVPLVQATLLYARMSDPSIACESCSPGRSQEQGALWAYATAVIPAVSQCDPAAGALLFENVHPSTIASGKLMASGFPAVAAALQSTYPCLAVKCADVGGTASIAACSDASTAAPTNSSSPCLSSGAIAGVVIGVLVASALWGLSCFCLGRRRGIGERREATASMNGLPRTMSGKIGDSPMQSAKQHLTLA